MKKFSIILIAVVVLSLLVAVFAVNAFAEGETITVTYNWHGGGVRGTVKPNEDGSYTLRTDKLSGNATSTLTDGTVVDREFYGWYDEEGNLYAPGATVNFDKTTMLYEAYGVTVYNADDLKKLTGECYVKLGTDITLGVHFDRDWSVSIINLNGYTLTCTANDVANIRRSSFVVHGPGKLNHEPATVKTGADEFAVFIYGHGYGDDDCPQQFWIGKGVEFNTPYSAFRTNNVQRNKHPKLAIAGTVNARALARINVITTEATCTIYDSAKITTTESFVEFTNQTGIGTYMYMTLDGTINVANGEGTILTDFVLKRVNVTVNGGKYCVAPNDKENISYYLSNNLMVDEKVEGELTWMEVVPSDCVHVWVKDVEQSIEPTISTFGKDVLHCTVCARTKTVVTAYNPSEASVTITVRDENGAEEEKTVKASDVFEFSVTGVGENTSFAITGIKGTLGAVVEAEVPVGVGAINVTMANSTLETLNIADGVDVGITSLAGLSAIKTINVGASTVIVSSTGSNTSLESFISAVAGASVTFKNSCFDGKGNLKYLTMANGSSYTFGENSFRKTGIETLIFPDEATITFAGGAAFYNAAVKYAYFGQSIKEIKNKPLDCALNLELVVIKAATYVDQYCFCVDGATKATSLLKVYCHSADISLNGNAFINRQNYGVEFYTIDPDIKSIANCTYTVYNGIPHAYEEGIVLAPTCISTGTAGSTTDCVCGVNEVVTYTVYTASGSEEFTTAQREIPMSDVHVLGGALVSVNYANGYDQNGTYIYLCGVCGEVRVEDTSVSVAPAFECVGYSVSEAGDNGIVLGYMVNLDVIGEINAIEGVTLKYGVFAVSQNKLGENDVFGENGASEGVLWAYTSHLGFSMFELKVTGFVTDVQKAAKLAIGAFVELNDNGEKEISYIQTGDAVEGEKYYFASYNEMLELAK